MDGLSKGQREQGGQWKVGSAGHREKVRLRVRVSVAASSQQPAAAHRQKKKSCFGNRLVSAGEESGRERACESCEKREHVMRARLLGKRSPVRGHDISTPYAHDHVSPDLVEVWLFWQFSTKRLFGDG